MMTAILYIAIGLFGGILGGMGVGGGVIVISILSLFLGLEQQTAQGLNLLYFVPTAICALVVHLKNKAVDIKAAILMVLCGLLGAMGGSLLAVVVSSPLLKKLFGVFLLLVGLYEIFKKSPQAQEQTQENPEKTPESDKNPPQKG